MQRDIFEECRGKWRGILSTLGVDQKQLSKKHTPCPLCGGVDRFMFDDKGGSGSSICQKCGARTGFQLASELRGWDFKTACDELRAIIGTVRADPIQNEMSDAKKREACRQMWRAARPVTRGDPVDLYLRGRGLDLATVPRSLRFHPDCRWNPERSFPAMLAVIEGTDGHALLHRTFLTADGHKAPVDDPRRMMPGKFPLSGAVRLAPPGPVMGIAEGIETALAASALNGIPVWSAVNVIGLGKFDPPDECRKLVIFGDNDASYTGQASSYCLARSLVTGPREIEVEVAIPERVGADWADLVVRDAVCA
jgi:putative DNA primase/helicase